MKETNILGLYSKLGSSWAHKNKLIPFKYSWLHNYMEGVILNLDLIYNSYDSL